MLLIYWGSISFSTQNVIARRNDEAIPSHKQTDCHALLAMTKIKGCHFDWSEAERRNLPFKATRCLHKVDMTTNRKINKTSLRGGTTKQSQAIKQTDCHASLTMTKIKKCHFDWSEAERRNLNTSRKMSPQGRHDNKQENKQNVIARRNDEAISSHKADRLPRFARNDKN